MRAQYILLLLCAALPLRAITTPEIAVSALTPDCVNYRVVGLCYWLYCTPFGCTVRTSAHPRYEDPFDIILQIEEGMRPLTQEYVIVVDRESAIGYAVDMLQKGDVLLIAGKGGERYQEIMGVRHIYSDVAAVRDAIAGTEEDED